MYRSKLLHFIDLVDNFVGNESCLIENFCALNDSVTYSGNFAHRLDNGSFTGCKNFNKLCESFCMSWERAVSVNLSAVESLVGDVTVDADTVAVALCDNALIVHIEQLIFE